MRYVSSCCSSPDFNGICAWLLRWSKGLIKLPKHEKALCCRSAVSLWDKNHTWGKRSSSKRCRIAAKEVSSPRKGCNMFEVHGFRWTGPHLVMKVGQKGKTMAQTPSGPKKIQTDFGRWIPLGMGWANQRLYEAEPEQWKENLNRAGGHGGHGGHGGRGFGVAYRLTCLYLILILSSFIAVCNQPLGCVWLHHFLCMCSVWIRMRGLILDKL